MDLNDTSSYSFRTPEPEPLHFEEKPYSNVQRVKIFNERFSPPKFEEGVNKKIITIGLTNLGVSSQQQNQRIRSKPESLHFQEEAHSKVYTTKISGEGASELPSPPNLQEGINKKITTVGLRNIETSNTPSSPPKKLEMQQFLSSSQQKIVKNYHVKPIQVTIPADATQESFPITDAGKLLDNLPIIPPTLPNHSGLPVKDLPEGKISWFWKLDNTTGWEIDKNAYAPEETVFHDVRELLEKNEFFDVLKQRKNEVADLTQSWKIKLGSEKETPATPFMKWISSEIDRGGSLKALDGGMGGAYFLSDNKGTPIAVVKPLDEDILCINNRKRVSSPYLDNIHRVRGGNPLYTSPQTETLAYDVAVLLGVQDITPKTELKIIKNDHFHDLTDNVLESEFLRSKIGEPERTKLCSVQEFIQGARDLTDFTSMLMTDIQSNLTEDLIKQEKQEIREEMHSYLGEKLKKKYSWTDDTINSSEMIKNKFENEIQEKLEAKVEKEFERRMDSEVTGQMSSQVDQNDVEKCLIFGYIIGEQDGNAGNFMTYPKGKDAEGHQLYGLKKVDNALGFPSNNYEKSKSVMDTCLPDYFPETMQNPLSDELKSIINSIDVKQIAGKVEEYLGNSKDSIHTENAIIALEDRVEKLKNLAKRPDVTLNDIVSEFAKIKKAKAVKFAPSVLQTAAKDLSPSHEIDQDLEDDDDDDEKPEVSTIRFISKGVNIESEDEDDEEDTSSDSGTIKYK